MPPVYLALTSYAFAKSQITVPITMGAQQLNDYRLDTIDETKKAASFSIRLSNVVNHHAPRDT
ncbi:hypothetical protein ASF29_17760 [Rhizobium sp. Leaf262]|nr:hypothetical protein ASF29_17760 [Rhizobium sp. Leaf262]